MSSIINSFIVLVHMIYQLVLSACSLSPEAVYHFRIRKYFLKSFCVLIYGLESRNMHILDNFSFYNLLRQCPCSCYVDWQSMTMPLLLPTRVVPLPESQATLMSLNYFSCCFSISFSFCFVLYFLTSNFALDLVSITCYTC